VIPLFAPFGLQLKMHAALPILMASAAFMGHGKTLLVTAVALAIHEAAHAIAARALGQSFESIEVMPFGGVAQMDVHALRPEQEAVISLAGPAASLGLSLLIAASGWTGPLAQSLLRASFSLAVFNLLPALPLDGGRAIRALLSRRLGRPRATRMLIRIGIGIGGGILLLGLFAAARGSLNPLLFLTGAYQIYAALKEQESLAAACIAALYGREKRLHREGLLPIKWLAAPEDFRPEKLAARLTAGSYHMFVLVGAGMRKSRTMDEGELMRLVLENQLE